MPNLAINPMGKVWQATARLKGAFELSRVVLVLLAKGRKPGVNLKGGDLTVTYAPDKGVSGRPSSKRIIKIMDR